MTAPSRNTQHPRTVGSSASASTCPHRLRTQLHFASQQQKQIGHYDGLSADALKTECGRLSIDYCSTHSRLKR